METRVSYTDASDGVINVRKYKPEKPASQTIKIELEPFAEPELGAPSAAQTSVEEELGMAIAEILSAIKESFNAHSVCFAWASANKKKFYLAHKETSSERFTSEKWLAFGSDALTQVFLARNGQLYTEISPEDEPKLLRYYGESAGVRAFMGVPIFHRDQVYGVLFADSQQKGAFRQEHVKSLNRFGKICSALIDNYAVKSGHLESIRFVEPSISFIHALYAEPNLETQLKAFCDAIQSVVDAEHLALALLNSRSELRIRTVRTKTTYVPENEAIDIEGSAVGQAVARGESGIIDDLSSLNGLPRFFADEGQKGLRAAQGSMLIMPIQLGDFTAGVVTLESSQKHFFSRETAQKAKFFVNALSLSLNAFWLKDRIRQISPRDEETGALSARHFYERLRYEINRATREEKDMALVLIEFDDQKGLMTRSNNNPTILANLMRATARMIAANVRNYDLVGRVGKMRFAVCLYGIAEMHARFWAEKTREQVLNFPFETDDQFRTILATVSVGLAKLRRERADLDLWLEDAEKALLLAQTSGGNCVKIF
ncbi:MAG: GAF domain-containing protein [Chloroherpetonaceae bacterium]|nr:GAF domain-containing protein [Chloroherpetonaceae bacterium]MDW8436821.1 GAF domain-containing protein [Chloroherpetonaceae bacterium]